MPHRALPALAALALLAGCSAPKQTHELSGFLGDTSQMRVRHDLGGLLYYEKENARILEYEKVLLEPPVVLFSPGADPSAVSAKDREGLAAYFGERMRAAIEDGYPIVTQPGPDVLRVRAAITGVSPVRTPGYAAEHDTGPSLDVGSAAIEAEVVDSMTGERLAAFADNQGIRRFGSLGFASKWSDAKAAFDDWAKRFRHWLDVEHGRTQPTAPDER